MEFLAFSHLAVPGFIGIDDKLLTLLDIDLH